MKFLFGFELLSSILYFLLLLLISHTERLSSLWNLEHFKYLIIGFFFNKRERREKLLEQCKEILREQWLYYNMSESSWVGGGLGNSSFRKKLVFVLASWWKVSENCPKSCKAIMVIVVLSLYSEIERGKKIFFHYVLWK